MSIPEHIASIVLQISFISAFIVIFFFTIVHKIEEQILKEQLDYVVKVMQEDTSITTLPLIKPDPNLKKADDEVEKQNQVFINWSIVMVVFMVVIGIAIVGGLWWVYRFPLKDMLKHVLLMVMVVAATETFFLFYIARYYMSLDPNFVKRLFLRNSPLFI